MSSAKRQRTVAKEFFVCFLGFYCSFVCFCRIAAGLLTLLISFFSLASLCKSENKYRDNEDLKVYFYQVSCYFSVILNVRGVLCANFYVLSRNMILPRPQFSRKKIIVPKSFLLGYLKRTMCTYLSIIMLCSLKPVLCIIIMIYRCAYRF